MKHIKMYEGFLDFFKRKEKPVLADQPKEPKCEWEDYEISALEKLGFSNFETESNWKVSAYYREGSIEDYIHIGIYKDVIPSFDYDKGEALDDIKYYVVSNYKDGKRLDSSIGEKDSFYECNLFNYSSSSAIEIIKKILSDIKKNKL